MSRFFQALERAKQDRLIEEGPRRQEAVETWVEPVPQPLERPETKWVPPEPPSLRLEVEEPIREEVEEIREEKVKEASRGIDEPLVSLLTPTSLEADQYRGLRYAIEQLHKTEGICIVAVSSPSTGDGKTTTAINLAGALAQAAEARVLLIDADLRRPSVARRLGLTGSQGRSGLVDAISNPSRAVEDIIRSCPPFNLDVLPGGQPAVSPYELLRSPRLLDLLAWARARYDYVVVDTPPLLPIPDSRILTKLVDGFLVVVSAHKTPSKLLGEALSLIDAGKVIGIVFNGDDDRLSGYYRYYYTNGHDKKNSDKSGLWKMLLGNATGGVRRALKP